MKGLSMEEGESDDGSSVFSSSDEEIAPGQRQVSTATFSQEELHEYLSVCALVHANGFHLPISSLKRPFSGHHDIPFLADTTDDYFEDDSCSDLDELDAPEAFAEVYAKKDEVEYEDGKDSSNSNRMDYESLVSNKATPQRLRDELSIVIESMWKEALRHPGFEGPKALTANSKAFLEHSAMVLIEDIHNRCLYMAKNCGHDPQNCGCWKQPSRPRADWRTVCEGISLRTVRNVSGISPRAVQRGKHRLDRMFKDKKDAFLGFGFEFERIDPKTETDPTDPS